VLCKSIIIIIIIFRLPQPLMVAGVCYVKVRATSRSLDP